MSDETDQASADRALKTKHRAMWNLGAYHAVAGEVIPHLGARLVAACGISSSQRVLDVAAGTGNAAIPAALTGASVVASDLAPELFEIGRPLAELRGAKVDWEEADAEALPYDDDSFDVVMSCVGVMFAPHHQASADELVRVTKPGGKIGLISWTPTGFIGELFKTMKPYAPPPPPGAQPPPLWGDESHLRELFGDRVTDVEARVEQLPVTRFAQPEEWRDFFKAFYGPTIAAYRNLADDPERTAELDESMADLARRFGFGAGPVTEWEYLLFTATKV